MAAGTILFVLALVGVAIAAVVYFVGIPAEWKEAAEDKLIQEAAEGQAKDMLKDGIRKLPEQDRKNARKLERGINKATGGDLKNPLGSVAGGVATGVADKFD